MVATGLRIPTIPSMRVSNCPPPPREQEEGTDGNQSNQTTTLARLVGVFLSVETVSRRQTSRPTAAAITKGAITLRVHYCGTASESSATPRQSASPASGAGQYDENVGPLGTFAQAPPDILPDHN